MRLNWLLCSANFTPQNFQNNIYKSCGESCLMEKKLWKIRSTARFCFVEFICNSLCQCLIPFKYLSAQSWGVTAEGLSADLVHFVLIGFICQSRKSRQVWTAGCIDMQKIYNAPTGNFTICRQKLLENADFVLGLVLFFFFFYLLQKLI